MRKFKYYEQVKINRPSDRYDMRTATIKGYLCDSICYLEINHNGPKNRNGKPIIQTYQEQFLVALG